MRKLLFTLFIMTLILTACGPEEVVIVQPTMAVPAFNQVLCDKNWKTLDVEDNDIGWIIDYLLNTNHPPDSVGAYLAECIKDGWTGWR